MSSNRLCSRLEPIEAHAITPSILRGGAKKWKRQSLYQMKKWIVLLLSHDCDLQMLRKLTFSIYCISKVKFLHEVSYMDVMY